MNQSPRAPREYAREILEAEIRGIRQVIDSIGEPFEQAIRAIIRCTDGGGRVIVTGVGKPWFIAQKISATMASTGTPSWPLHPSDAVHGDIGRVRQGDVVMMLSNSGESEEIVRIIPLVRQFGALLIGVTGHPESSLGREADICLAYGAIDEACPLGLAPSASSTAMLALGDAVALTVLRERNFGREDYARFHPGGALGRKLMRVDEIMRGADQTPLVRREALVSDVLVAITEKRAGAAFIVDEQGRLIGVFTDGDLRRHLAADPMMLREPVVGHMTRGPRTIGGGRLVADALRIMRDHRIDELPVVDPEGSVVGYLDVQDLLATGLAIATD